MRSQPTTTVDLLGGAAVTDAYGDEDESLTPLATDVPCSLLERNMPTVSTEGSPVAIVIERWVGRVPQGTPVDNLSRVRDRRTGVIYAVDKVSQPLHPTTPQDIRLDLRRVS